MPLSTMPLTNKIFRCPIFCRIRKAFSNHMLCQLLEQFEIGTFGFKACISSRLCILKRYQSSLCWVFVLFCFCLLVILFVYLFFFFSSLLRQGSKLQNDTKLETTSCFIAENYKSFCTGSLWESYWWYDYINFILNDCEVS